MSVCSPYAVFKATENPWAPGPTVAPAAVINLLAAIPAARPPVTRQRRKSGGNARAPVIQGELFQLG